MSMTDFACGDMPAPDRLPRRAHLRKVRRVLAGAAIAVALLAGLAWAVRATTLFSEDFESAQGLDDGKWLSGVNRYSSTIANGQGMGGSKCMKFNRQLTYGYGDTWSIKIINLAGNKTYYVTLDYKESAAGGIVAIEEFNSGGNWLNDIYLMGNAPTNPIFVWNGAGTGWHHYTTAFTTMNQTRQIDLVVMDYSSSGLPVGHVYMDNILISDTPPAGVTPVVVRWQEVVK